MRNLVTISDYCYLEKGLTLYDSLRKTQDNNSFKLYYICLDDKTYNVINNIKNNSIEAVKIGDLEEDNFELKNMRNLPPSKEAISNGNAQNRDPYHIQFCWALSSYACFYFLHRRNLDNIYYLDSDLYFYNDLSLFDNEVLDKSIGIVRHRIDYLPSSGEFNVGIVYFKNNYAGKKCSLWWKKQMSTPPEDNPYFPWYGQCGDQKYLELFPLIFGEEVCIVDKNVGHLAPWNVTFHDYKNDKVIWNNIEQDLLYFHFSHFKVFDDSYKTSYNNEWIWGVPELSNKFVKEKYDDYYIKTKNTIKEYNLNNER